MLLTAYYPKVKAKYCPVCGGGFYKRSLDKPEVIKVRLKEYKNRTEPIFGIIRKLGYELQLIDAKVAPYKVLQKIATYIVSRGRGVGRKNRVTLASTRNIDFYHLFLS
jgi:adenylate kinase family enzyme